MVQWTAQGSLFFFFFTLPFPGYFFAVFFINLCVNHHKTNRIMRFRTMTTDHIGWLVELVELFGGDSLHSKIKLCSRLTRAKLIKPRERKPKSEAKK